MTKNLPLWGQNITARNLLVPTAGAMLMGLLSLFIGSGRPIPGAMFALAWLGIAVLGASSFHVLRAHERRIGALEEALAKALERDGVSGSATRP